MSQTHFYFICALWLGVAVVVHVLMFFFTAPFGRHTSPKWGPMVNNKLAWVLMESPSLGIMVYFFALDPHPLVGYSALLFGAWIFHYANRTLAYPFRIRPTQKKMPALIVLFAICFNVMNAGLNGYFLKALTPSGSYGATWLQSPNFIIGATLFLTGLVVNWAADHQLIHLRKPGETGYTIPSGFLFRYVSSPNLFGEIVEWAGFALMAWNLPALTFLAWTLANLVPRAKNHHDWYLRHFPDYPAGRKRVFPLIF